MYLVYNTVVPEKKVLVVCLVGAQSLLRPEKKSSSCLSGGCAITTISTTGPIYAKSSDFYAKLVIFFGPGRK